MADQGQGAAGGQPRPLQMGAKGAYIVRLLMVGDSSCGKTSLVLRFDQNVFSTKFVTTIGVDYRDKMVKVRTHPRTINKFTWLLTWKFLPKKTTFLFFHLLLSLTFLIFRLSKHLD
jgi:Ras family